MEEAQLELKLLSPSAVLRNRIVSIVMAAHPGNVQDPTPRPADYMKFTLPTVST
jgi:hypothetical protein